MTMQLALALAAPVADEERFAFVAVCWRCGARSEPIPCEPVNDWKAPSMWAVVALSAHERDCPGAPTTGAVR